jgi:type 1 fimbria pilin
LGSLASGPYTTYDYTMGNSPLLTTSFSANALTIVSPSCLVAGGNNQNVDIGNIHLNQLSSKGCSAGGRSFPLELQCSGGVSLSESTNINMTFDGTLATGTTTAQGVLINKAGGEQVAQGVGVQILNSDHTPLEMGTSQRIGQLNNCQIHYINLKYFARFYQYLDSISAGEVRGHLVFNIDYD